MATLILFFAAVTILASLAAAVLVVLFLRAIKKAGDDDLVSLAWRMSMLLATVCILIMYPLMGIWWIVALIVGPVIGSILSLLFTAAWLRLRRRSL